MPRLAVDHTSEILFHRADAPHDVIRRCRHSLQPSRLNDIIDRLLIRLRALTPGRIPDHDDLVPRKPRRKQRNEFLCQEPVDAHIGRRHLGECQQPPARINLTQRTGRSKPKVHPDDDRCKVRCDGNERLGRHVEVPTETLEYRPPFPRLPELAPQIDVDELTRLALQGVRVIGCVEHPEVIRLVVDYVPITLRVFTNERHGARVSSPSPRFDIA